MGISRILFAALFFAQSLSLVPYQAQAAGLGFVAAATNTERVAQSVSYRVTKAVGQDSSRFLKIDALGAEKNLLSSVLLPEKKALTDLASASRMGHKVVVVDSWSKMKFMLEKTKTSAAARTSEEVLFRFPTEAFGFFLAIGILNVKDLVTNFSGNPMILDQYLSSQKDPIGHLGFLAFMMANAHLTGPLMAATDPNSKFKRAAIPYLGMTVGMLASNVVHEIANIKSVSQCVADLRTRVQDEKKYASCQVAYDNWMSFGWEKINEMAPSLFSMFGSTLVSGVLERYAIQKAIMAMGWEVLLMASPQGWGVAGARFLYKIVQFSMFTQLDIWMRPLFETPFKNVRDGGAFNRYERNLMTLLAEKKKNSWSESKLNLEYDLDLELRRFAEKMRAWRQMNMTEVMTAHSSWMQYLSNFTSMYQGAKVFYPTFINELIVKSKNDPAFQSLTQLPMPLYGVKPKAPEIESTKLDLLNMPSEYSYRQIQTLIDVRLKFEKVLAENESAKQLMRGNSRSQIVTTILSQLPTEKDYQTNNLDLVKMGKALDLLRNEIRFSEMPVPSYTGLRNLPAAPMPQGRFGDYREILVALFNEIGRPEPIWKNGIGFFVAYDQDKNAQEIQQSVVVPKHSKGISTFSASQYYVAQMLQGPDVESRNQGLINNPWSGMAEFVPPRIIPQLKMYSTRPIQGGGLSTEALTLFNSPVRVDAGKNQMVEYPNYFEILKIENLQPGLMKSKTESNISQWWTEKVETQFIQAFQSYEDQYQRNLVRLVELFKDSSDNFANTGNAASNVLESLKQERRIYLMTLGELLKDLAQDQKINASALLNDAKVIQKSGIQIKPWDVQDLNKARNSQQLAELDETPLVPLLKVVRQNTNLNLSALLSSLGRKRVSFTNDQVQMGNLQIQDEIEEKFKNLENLLARYQVQAVEQNRAQYPSESGTLVEFLTTDKIVVSDVTNQQIDQAQKQIEESIKKFESLYKEKALRLTDIQNRILQSALHGLTSVANETASLGQIANSVSFKRKNQDANGMNQTSQECFLNAATATKTDRTGRKFELESAKCKELARQAVSN